MKREIRLERATKTVAMAENRPWSTKRKTKARSARLAAAQMSRVTAERTQKLHSGQTTELLNPVFDSVTVKLIHKFFRKAREYESLFGA